jgi:uncharacterized protein (TIGR02466 family)
MNFTEKSIQPLFATPLFESIIEDTNFLTDICENILNLKNLGYGDEDALGWQSFDDIHKLPEFADLTQTFTNEVNSIMEFLKIKKDSCYLTSMWANVGVKPEYFHPTHIHPNSLLSGIFYISMPEQSVGTSFCDPRPSARILEPSYKELNQWNSGVYTADNKEGRMYIFPSYLPHFVHQKFEPHQHDNKRITISFNAMITGKIDNKTAPLELK